MKEPNEALAPEAPPGTPEANLSGPAKPEKSPLLREVRSLAVRLAVCRLCLLEEKTPEEAALALGRPVKTIHTQLSRGKRMLREALERSGNDDMLSP